MFCIYTGKTFSISIVVIVVVIFTMRFSKYNNYCLTFKIATEREQDDGNK